ncbi:bZIP transcription factor [Spirosoma sp. BT702]|uniref:BZIP transcription factor n=1 Tax=Spirosoma profusum TaxID=2771354 RepID=A0A926XY68_9BACT|nr:bZIP transcription factor [Spirosoma profusum]MBD2699993.1 bZIP transcription factor [Spirosoma profusum]
MKLSYLLSFLILMPTVLLAQNYVVNTGNSSTPGYGNILIGPSAGNLMMTGGHNVILGTNAGSTNSTGADNVMLGASAGFRNTTGSDNCFMGYQAGFSNTTGRYNTFMGSDAGSDNTTGEYNTILGYRSGFNNTTGSNNVFVGQQAGKANTTGIANLFMGSFAGASSNGSYNLFIGNSSGQQTTSGGGNTFIGNGSGYGNTTGQNNTYIGNGAGFTGNGPGQSNTFIGQNAGVTSGAVVNNSTAIGAGAQVSADNSIVLGAPNPLWKVGIGNTAPNNKLEITHGTPGQSGLRFTNLTSIYQASVTNQTRFLTVNSAGDVILGSINGSTREGVSETLWQRKGSFLQSTQNDAVIIGEGISKTPADYNLFVSKGILTEKVKVAIKNTSDWSDKVFDDSYTLKTLSEVEKYIQSNKHLPGVPSAKEVVEKGVDVAKMDAKLLEKIEELTLYSIEQEKTIKLQQAQIDELKALMRQVLEKR